MRRAVVLLGAIVAGFLGAPAAEAQTSFLERAWEDSGFVSINYGYQVGDRSFADSFSEALYDEVATYEVDHRSGGGGVFDVSGGVRVWRNLAAGLGVTRFSINGGAAVTGSVPHPLFFNQPRNGLLNSSDLEHTQTAVHLQAVWVMPVTDRIDISVSGGPSFFMVDQGIITSVTVDEVSAPFEVVDLINPTIDAVSENAVGGNVGVDITYMVTERYGGGIFARWTGASVDIAFGGGSSLDVGGAQFGIGMRARF
jgi:hypothetical protein